MSDLDFLVKLSQQIDFLIRLVTWLLGAVLGFAFYLGVRFFKCVLFLLALVLMLGNLRAQNYTYTPPAGASTTYSLSFVNGAGDMDGTIVGHVNVGLDVIDPSSFYNNALKYIGSIDKNSGAAAFWAQSNFNVLNSFEMNASSFFGSALPLMQQISLGQGNINQNLWNLQSDVASNISPYMAGISNAAQGLHTLTNSISIDISSVKNSLDSISISLNGYQGNMTQALSDVKSLVVATNSHLQDVKLKMSGIATDDAIYNLKISVEDASGKLTALTTGQASVLAATVNAANDVKLAYLAAQAVSVKTEEVASNTKDSVVMAGQIFSSVNSMSGLFYGIDQSTRDSLNQMIGINSGIGQIMSVQNGMNSSLSALMNNTNNLGGVGQGVSNIDVNTKDAAIALNNVNSSVSNVTSGVIDIGQSARDTLNQVTGINSGIWQIMNGQNTANSALSNLVNGMSQIQTEQKLQGDDIYSMSRDTAAISQSLNDHCLKLGDIYMAAREASNHAEGVFDYAKKNEDWLYRIEQNTYDLTGKAGDISTNTNLIANKVTSVESGVNLVVSGVKGLNESVENIAEKSTEWAAVNKDLLGKIVLWNGQWYQTSQDLLNVMLDTQTGFVKVQTEMSKVTRDVAEILPEQKETNRLLEKIAGNTGTSASFEFSPTISLTVSPTVNVEVSATANVEVSSTYVLEFSGSAADLSKVEGLLESINDLLGKSSVWTAEWSGELTQRANELSDVFSDFSFGNPADLADTSALEGFDRALPSNIQGVGTGAWSMSLPIGGRPFSFTVPVLNNAGLVRGFLSACLWAVTCFTSFFFVVKQIREF